MTHMTLQQAFDLAVQHHMAGQFHQAENLYRQILVLEPRHAGATHFLGLLAHQAGRSDVAVELIRNAIGLGLNTPEVFGNLGNALRGSGQLDEAITAFRRSLALNPNLAATHINLGNALQAKGEPHQAISAFRQAIAADPNLAEGYNNLGKSLTDISQFDNAIAACSQALALRPGYSDACINLGNAYRFKGQLDQAIAAYRRALTVDRSTTVSDVDLAKVQSSLAGALNDLGKVDQAIAAYREAIRLDPADARHGSNLLLMLQYHADYDSKSIAVENERWNRQHAVPLASGVRSEFKSPPDSSNAHRRLRIGYVSPDFKDHAVGRNMLPLFREHDHQQFEIFCYSNGPGTDDISAEFRKLADSFTDITHLSDEQAAVKIRADQIDILVDLALHTYGNRLLIFARKPAPIQVTFAGYPASTGLTAIDYRLSDPYLDPVGTDESVYSEKTIRLPDSFWCYDPLDCRDIPVGSLPALHPSLHNGTVTFGCLNNFCKINDDVLGLWANVLRQVENSRLLLLTRSGSLYPHTLDLLAREGIAPERIECVKTGPRRAYLEAYHRIDIGLDSFPYTGHTTSLDSFWMGVPVVTLVGKRSVARAGWCQLSNLGLTELAADTPEQFLSIAVGLANDLNRLAALRTTLRQRMEQSPLMDAPKFARNIEAAYRQMWNASCALAHASGAVTDG